VDRRLSEFVRVYDQALPAAVCDRTIALFERTEGGPVRRQVENLKQFDELVIDGRPEWAEHQARLEALKREWLARYQRDCPGLLPAEYDFEAFRIKRYRPEAGDDFKEHVDAYNAASGRRFLVCFWYLNDVDQGGETVFTRLDIKVRPRQGRLIMFPPYWMYEHAALPPVSGRKYIISTYFLYR